MNTESTKSRELTKDRFYEVAKQLATRAIRFVEQYPEASFNGSPPTGGIGYERAAEQVLLCAHSLIEEIYDQKEESV